MTRDNPFQFTHPCGCDRAAGNGGEDGVRFQFTHPCGCDDIFDGVKPEAKVSIHAPVWVRHPLIRQAAFLREFQFTHPCGCDHQCLGLCLEQIRFNSRTRVGATGGYPVKAVLTRVSIHAPVWVRPSNTALNSSPRSFNSRTRVGATTYDPEEIRQYLVSIHAPVWVRRHPATG